MAQIKHSNSRDKYNKIIYSRSKNNTLLNNKITITMSCNMHRITNSSLKTNMVMETEALVVVVRTSQVRCKICLTNMTNMLMK